MTRLLLGIALLSLSFGGCAGHQAVGGMPSEVLRHISGGKSAITLTDKTVLFFGEAQPPSACLVAHESEHQKQVAEVCGALVDMGAIYDDEESCFVVWLAVYGQGWAVHGADNRWEKGAREASAAECGRSP